ncbi:cyclin-dependent kinase inhibitor 7-like [Andrographis paniculata]|uniref:cyclin-dependent kinase inhibitor 7-like n=1 Tax=Andrographis paniculata TaxID=175694 RepID=UPI0021E72231|nr:cyclin-dependent kinase inhibitor 7-like [Andrographis paniculata]
MKNCGGFGEAEVMEAAAGGRKRKFVLADSNLLTISAEFKNRRLAVWRPDAPSSPRENELTVEFSAASAGDSVNFSDRRQKSASSEVEGDFNPHHCTKENQMPGRAEIEEFFAAAEKNLQKQFTDKYNYDVVKDEPMEGRYEWIHLKSPKITMKLRSSRH